MRWLLALLLASGCAAFCPDVFQNQTACSCEDYIDGAVIKCSGSDGPMIIEKIKRYHIQIRELRLEHANIVEIGPRAFKNLRIKKLVLDKNRIKGLHSSAFHGLETVLQELSIAENRLTQVPTATLEGMRALNIVNLKCNKIGNMTEQAFNNTPALIDINLACNQICDINSTAFSSLRGIVQNLILDNNCMTKFPAQAVANMENLIALHLKYNELQAIEQNDLTNLTMLSMLTLTGNNISRISGGAIVNTPNLRYLYLGENNITQFDAGVMGQFKQAQVVDLSFNYIEEITAETFTGLESLQHLNLESNRIREIASGSFAGTPLLLLWLPNNCLTSVNQQIFQGAPFLRQVSLSNNNIKEIQPLSFSHLANLHTLDLAYNKIMSLDTGAVSGSDHLTVRLQENPMVCTQDGFHVMNGNEFINLTTEANKICQGRWKEVTEDVCPKEITRPEPQPCCVKAVTTTKAPTTTTTATTPKPKEVEYEDSEEETEPDEKTHHEDEKETVNGETEDTENDEEEEEEEEEEAHTTTKTIKRLNMDRFYRLSKHPSGSNSPYLRHVEKSNIKPKYLLTTEVSVPKDHIHEEEEKPRRRHKSYRKQKEEQQSAEYEEENEEEPENDETDTKTSHEKTVNAKVPARVVERRKMLAKLPPWMSKGSHEEASPKAHREEQPEEEFNEDAEAEEVQHEDDEMRH